MFLVKWKLVHVPTRQRSSCLKGAWVFVASSLRDPWLGDRPPALSVSPEPQPSCGSGSPGLCLSLSLRHCHQTLFLGCFVTTPRGLQPFSAVGSSPACAGFFSRSTFHGEGSGKRGGNNNAAKWTKIHLKLRPSWEKISFQSLKHLLKEKNLEH